MTARAGRRRLPILLAAIAALLVFIAVDAVSSPVRAQNQSTDASLKSLSLSDITLDPTFSAATTSYTDYDVESSVTSTTVTAETTDTNATAVIKINGVEDEDGTVDLVAGYNVITVEVTAQDGTTTRTYTVTVLRAQPQDTCTSGSETITSLLSRLDAELIDASADPNVYVVETAGYRADQGDLSPAGFNYPAAFGPWYTVENLRFHQEGAPGSVAVGTLILEVRGAVTSVTGQDADQAHVLPADADITLHLEGDDFTWSASLDDAVRTNAACVKKDGSTRRDCRVGETKTEKYDWDGTQLPRLAGGEKIIVRLRYEAPRPGKPGRPLVTAPEGKSGVLVVNWGACENDPKVRGYEVHLSPAPGQMGATGATKVTGGSTTRLPVLLLEPDTAYDVRVRARTYLASGPWSETVRAKTNPLMNSGTNNPVVTLDLDGVAKVKVGDRLYKRLKVTGMDNLHAGAFSSDPHHDVEFRVLGGIHDSYVYEDLTRGYGDGAFYAGALTIGEDGEVYHNFGYEVIATGLINEGVPQYGPLYLWLERTTGVVQIGSTASSRATALCVEISDDSNTVPTDRECPPSNTDRSAGHAGDRLTGRFVNVPQSHDGESEFTVRLAFVEDVGISPTSLREDALAATGGAVTRVQRVDDRSDLFEITVEPDSDEDVTITLSSSGDCGESGAVCTQEEDPRKLYNSPTATVAGPILTASFQGLPSQHDGETAFSFRIAFSDEIATDAAEFRDHSVEVWGGEVTRAEPVGQRRDLWEVEVEPASEDMVMVSLKLTQSCAATGAVCTAGGRLLSVIPATMVPGPATWPVRVTGEARVGQTLTADSSNLSERYGVQVTSMTYRWLANGARVPGANARTYKPDDDKQGKRISVMATYTDDRGNEETVISAPTEPLAARDRIRRATGLPLISGRALVGHTLTADKSLIIDPNGLENAVFHYFWEADDDSIPDATDSTYTPVEADVGKEITFIVAWVDDAGHGQTMTSQPTMPVMTAEAAAAVEFRKSLRYVANADGSVTLHWNAPDDEVTGYRILRGRHSLGEHDVLVYVEDTGSAATTFTDADVVAGVPHSYRVQAIRDGELGERTKSFKTKVFPLQKATNSPATGAPAIGGTAQVGETLTADISGIADEDGLENVTKDYLWAAIGSSGVIGAKYAYQWLVDGADSGSGDHHAGYNNTTYTLTEDDAGKAMSVRVTFVDDAGYQETLTSAATDPVAAAPQPNSPATGAPAIRGTAQVGETLTADTSGVTDEDGLDDSTFTVQWITDDSVMVANAARSYTPTGGDRGKSVKVRVSFTDDAGNPETRTSAQTATVEARADGQEGNSPATGLPTISGTAQVGETLTANITGIADADGLSGESFTYQWVSGDGTTDTDIENATASTYTLVAADQGKSVKVRVTFTDDTGNEETLTSAPTEPVLGDGPPGAPRNLSATPGNKEVTLSWDPPADNGNAPATRYRIEWRVDGKDYSRSQWRTARSTTYTTNDQANLANGVKYFFRVRAGNGSGNSQGPYGPASGEVSATPTSGSAVDLGTPVLSDTETLHHGMVRLDWRDIEDAGWYVVQYYHVKGGEWLDLPAEGVDIAFHGSSAMVSNLHGLSWLRVRAMSCAGASEWSQIEQLFGTNESDWEGVPVPEVEEGDEIEPCPVVLGTPVLSETETLHHGMVQLDWQDIEDAGWYVVQYYHLEGGEWLDLPAEGVDIAFHGSGAVASNLHGLSWLRVRAMSCAGASEWSQIEQLFGTNASDWEGVPVPDVAEGDQIEPCSEDADTSDNSPATGAPTISGTAQVGETLTADTSGIADADGLANATFSYQWITDDSVIVASAARTYTPTDGDRGKSVKVRVSFTDDAGNPETRTSANTATVEARANSPATGAPTISGTAQVGETLTADTSGIADADGLSNVQYEYQWLADDSDISGATNATYTLVDADEGKAIKVRVSFTDDAGNPETRTSANTATVEARANSPATGAPTISGTAQVGETLTADTSGIADADGLGSVQYEYQWLADDSEIAGATNAAYTLVAEDEGKAIKVQVGFTDDEGNEESLTSGATAAVVARPNSAATGGPTITGTVQVGETLTADTSGVADADGLSSVQYEYQWIADDTDIAGASGSTYTLTDSEENKAITVQVSFTDDADNEETLTSGATAAVVARPNSPATGAPTISGTVQVGETLTADTSGIADADGLANATFSYQWLADDTDISGATGLTYTLTDSEESKAITVRVSFTDDADTEETLTSEPTGEVSEDYLLPDLVSDPPTRSGKVSVEVAPDGTELLALRFEGYVTNLGDGPLDLSGNPQLSDPADLTSHDVWQRALTTSGDWVQLTRPPVRYETADTHNHFHLMGVMAYSLWDETGTLQIRPSEKVGFCLVDTEHLPDRHSQPSVQGYEQSELRNCMRNEPDAQSLRMGVSAGWRDTYHRDMVFQWVDVSDVTPGVYRIGVQADPNDVVVESDETNNGVALSETVSSVPGYVAESQVVKARPGETVDIELTFSRYGSPGRRAHRIITAASNGTLATEDNFRVTDSSGVEHSAFYSKTVQYTPQADFVGVDTFTFIAFDSRRPDYPINPTLATVTIDATNSPATGEPTITGTVQVGETLTANTSGVADADGLGSVQYEYQWFADDAEVAGATGSTYTLVDADEGKAITVRVRFTDDDDNEETLTSEATDSVSAAPTPNSPATGVPTISGTAQVGQTLTADTSGIADDDGLSNVQYEYKWLADDSDIAGATNTTYALVAADEGKVIKVRVRFADDAGNEETLTSAATEASLSSEHVVAWSAIMTAERVDQGYGYSTYARKAGSLSPASFNVDGTTYAVNMVETWGWMYIGVDRELPFDFVLELNGVRFASNDASLASYTYGNVYRWARTALSWRDGDTVAVRLLRALEDETAVNSASTGAPTIGGTAQVGETLTANTSGIADADGLANATFSYQWLADDIEIAGATGSTYTLTDSEESKAITVRVSFTDDADNEETLTSAAADVVAGAQPTEPPAKPRNLSATATHDSVVLTWDDPGDDTITGYVILRRIPGVDPEGHFDELVANTGTDATTYTDNTVAAETRYTYRIKAISGAGTSERSRWFHIDTPAAPVPDKPTGLEATESHGQVVLTWDDPQDDSIIGYVILRRVRVNDTGGDFSVLVADTGSAATTYTDDTVAAGTTYTYRIKAINEHGTSERSRWYHIETPGAP